MAGNKKGMFSVFSEMSGTSKISTEEVYEKPALTVVNFMFESDITWGSFDDDSNGDNSVPTTSAWWQG